ncbi:flagellar hook-length control protein FliK [uncultured Jatrophihabitans sp.]|uniref:flagellar hook-length control protein FliK n=1 Tax=uncultured Jatrophihabitans sp. TaxID=1610747 RepID=UPI0035CC5F32
MSAPTVTSAPTGVPGQSAPAGQSGRNPDGTDSTDGTTDDFGAALLAAGAPTTASTGRSPAPIDPTGSAQSPPAHTTPPANRLPVDADPNAQPDMIAPEDDTAALTADAPADGAARPGRGAAKDDDPNAAPAPATVAADPALLATVTAPPVAAAPVAAAPGTTVAASPVTTTAAATTAVGTPATHAAPAPHNGAAQDASPAAVSIAGTPDPDRPHTTADPADPVTATTPDDPVATLPPGATPPAVPAAPPPAPQAVATAATQTAAAPAPVDPQPALTEALGRLRTRGDGTHELTVQLHPADLGSVQIRAVLHNGTLNLTVACADDAARVAVQAALPALHHQLGDLDRADVQLTGQRGAHTGGDPAASGHGSQHAGTDRRGTSSDGGTAARADSPAAMPQHADAPTRTLSTAGGAGLDRWM